MANNSVTLKRALFTKTGEYHEVFRNPYQLTLGADGDMIDRFENATDGGGRISNDVIGAIASSILRPNFGSAPDKVAIPNGWRVPRLRCLFEFEILLPGENKATTVEILTGYTDFVEFTIHGADDVEFAPDMKIFFNNAVTSTVVHSRHANGTHGERRIVTNASHVLASNALEIPDLRGGQQELTSLLPQDVMSHLETEAGDSRENYGDIPGMDFRQNFTADGIKKSRRSNGLPADYIARCINGIVNSDRGTDMSYMQPENSRYERARHAVREDSVARDAVFKLFNKEANFDYNQYITFADLAKIFPYFEEVSELIRPADNVYQTSLPNATDTSEWHRTTMETQIATILAQGVPALMMDIALSSIDFVATNLVHDRGVSVFENDVTIRDSRSFMGTTHLIPHNDLFADRFISEILVGLTDSNRHIVYLAVQCEVTGDTRISVSYNEGYTETFVMPTFCDALCAPVVSTDERDLDNLAKDLNVLANLPHLR